MDTENNNSSPVQKIAPLTFRKNGWGYTQVWREKDLAIYQQGAKPVAYEVHIIRKSVVDRTFPNGKIIPAGSEYLAGNEDFGRFGWTYNKIELAREKVKKIKKDRKVRIAEEKRRAKEIKSNSSNTKK